MLKSSFSRRIMSGIIDVFFLFVVLNLLSICFFSLFYDNEINMQMLPFILINIAFFPIDSIIKITKYPEAYLEKDSLMQDHWNKERKKYE